MNGKTGIATLAIVAVLVLGTRALADVGVSFHLGIPFARPHHQVIVRGPFYVAPYGYPYVRYYHPSPRYYYPYLRYNYRPGLRFNFRFDRDSHRHHESRRWERGRRPRRDDHHSRFRSLRHRGRRHGRHEGH